MKLNALILIGGQSTRMGLDKYLLNFHGLPQFQWLYQLTSKLGMRSYLSCNEQQAVCIDSNAYNLIIDDREQIGPLGGIYTAFQVHPNEAWMILACDMPNIDEHTLKQLIKARSTNKMGVAFKSKKGGFETTCCLLEPEIKSLVQEAVTTNQFKLQLLFEKADLAVLTPKNVSIFKNVNRPKDLK